MNRTLHNFSEIFIHIVWHCHDNRPLINEDIEPELYQFIEKYCRNTKGVYFKGLGGTPTHIHLAFQVEPHISFSDFIGKLKGASSHEMNNLFGKGAIQWQRGYGIVSFAKKNLSAIIKYIANQKEHHKKMTLNEVLETIAAEFKEKR
ncbi:IS200/IS605 family transposase [Calditrichota bacterium]